MTNTLKLAAFIILLLGLDSCSLDLINCINGEGIKTDRIIELGEDISKIELTEQADIIITEGETQEIRIEGFENFIDLIEQDSDVDGNKWTIKIDGRCADTDGLKIFAQLKSLESLEIVGSGSMKADEVLTKVDDLKLEIDGSGKIDMLIATASKVDIEINGSGEIKVEGITDRNSIEINGSGDVKTDELISTTCRVEINGSANAEVNVSDELDIEINGSGAVCYVGSPTITTDISGSGSVQSCN